MMFWLSVGVTAFVAPPPTAPTRRYAAETCVPLENELYQGWGVCATPSGAYRFNANKDFEIDDFETTIIKNPGLGIELEEIANNGEGIGIVVVTGAVPGSPAAESPLQPGDVIAKVGPTIVEAKTFDRLVDVLASADPTVQLTIKRLIPRVKVDMAVTFANDEWGAFEETVYAGENLRRALIARGVKVNDPKLGQSCGGDGTCTTCAVEVLGGAGNLNDVTSPEKIIFAKSPTWRLSCQSSVKEVGVNEQLKVKIYPHRET